MHLPNASQTIATRIIIVPKSPLRYWIMAHHVRNHPNAAATIAATIKSVQKNPVPVTIPAKPVIQTMTAKNSGNPVQVMRIAAATSAYRMSA
jgi:hypothetical protein